MKRRAFTLLEVLIATALFAIAAAGLLMAVSPTYDALAQLSDTTSDAGDLELVRAVAEASANREAALEGGSFALPSGDAVDWTLTLTPTDTECLYLVNLHATRGDRSPLDYEYLHFEPGWRDTSEEAPRWLTHSFGSGGGGGGGGVAPGGGNARGRGQGRGNGQNGQGQGRGQNGSGQGRNGRNGQAGQGSGQGRGQSQGRGNNAAPSGARGAGNAGGRGR